MEAEENQETKAMQYPDIPFAQSTRRFSTRRLGMERASLKGGKEEEWKPERESQENQKTKALWYPDLPWGLPSKIAKAPEKGMLFLKFWDILSALLSIYVAWSIPFMLGFDKMYNYWKNEQLGDSCVFNQMRQNGFSTLFSRLLVVDCVIDILFWFDMFINFTSAVWVLRVDPILHWDLVDNLDEIAKIYLAGSFTLDALGSIPGSFAVACMVEASGTTDALVLKAFRVIRLTKLVRLSRIERMLHLLEIRYPSFHFLIAAVTIVLYFFVGAHWLACIFFAIPYGIGSPDDPEDSHSYWLFFNGWSYTLGNAGFLDEFGDQKKFHAEAYLTSIYWAVQTMSTIGYGDISPATPPERVVGMLLMVTGAAFFAYITGRITTHLMQKSACEERFRAEKEMLDDFMHGRDVPMDIRKRAFDFFKMKNADERIIDEEHVLGKIENKAIRDSVLLHIFRDVVGRVHLFALCGEECQKAICRGINIIYRPPGRKITCAGELPDNMYMVRLGEVELISKSGKRRIGGVGFLFGELAIIGLAPDGRRLRTVVCGKVCELCQLSKDHFHEVMSQHADLFTIVRRACQYHIDLLQDSVFSTSRHRVRALGTLGIEAVKDVSQDSRKKEFFDQLSFIDWQKVYLDMLAQLESQKVRIARSKFDMEAVKAAVAETNTKFHLNLFRFQIRTLAVPYITSGETALIVIRWQGLPGVAATLIEIEGDFFRLQLAEGLESSNRFTTFSDVVEHAKAFSEETSETSAALKAGGPGGMKGHFQGPGPMDGHYAAGMPPPPPPRPGMDPPGLGDILGRMMPPPPPQRPGIPGGGSGALPDKQTALTKINIYKGIDVPIMTPVDAKWSQLPPLEIQIYFLDSAVVQARNQALLKEKEYKHIRSETRASRTSDLLAYASQVFHHSKSKTKPGIIGSTSFPEAIPTLVARVPMQELVENRGAGNDFKIQLSGSQAQNYVGELSLSLSVNRQPTSSAWSKLFSIIKSGRVAGYFARKNSKALDDIVDKNRALLDKVQEIRYSNLVHCLAKSPSKGVAASRVKSGTDRETVLMEMQFAFNSFLNLEKMRKEKISANQKEIAQLSDLVSNMHQLLATGKPAEKNATSVRSAEQRQAKEDLRDDRHERLLVQSSVTVTAAGIKVAVADERGVSFSKETRLLPGVGCA